MLRPDAILLYYRQGFLVQYAARDQAIWCSQELPSGFLHNIIGCICIDVEHTEAQGEDEHYGAIEVNVGVRLQSQYYHNYLVITVFQTPRA